ncbi:hydrolase domain protein [Mycobacterium ulcerans str. Harvey]|uniref:Hydrolase domain protein n=1 Tax=Mycobacterium ulcerans str. Harvey TaxID=1299332 RepID=A0ABN0R960_MYCUL|nr:hydrolase domain protein [Mycobacterium ulcerans str. Harvey]
MACCAGVTDSFPDDLTRLTEFDLLAENAEQAGVTGPLPEVERIEVGAAETRISALRWGGRARG